MRPTDFTYHLPPELLAHTAAEPRDSARLLRWPEATDHTFADLPNLLSPGDLLILNDSRVIPARLYATRPARAGQGEDVPVEILLHRPLEATLQTWQTFARPGRRLKEGDTLHLPGSATATVMLKSETPHIRLNLPPENIPGYLEEHGHTPLPPYISAQDTPTIRQRYQTVYADPAKPGSVAAPTAGLHVTPHVLQNLKEKGLNIAHVTLHVGAGTFLNPTPEQIAAQCLHPEAAHVPAATAKAILDAQKQGKNIIPVGTTALRTLETWAAHGSPAQGWQGESTLFIQPGYRFKVATRLITNFHLPQSSLLMLVAAFIGYEGMKQLYATAIQRGYRFYSFGDTSLLTRKDT